MVQHGLNEGVQNIYKTNAKLHILKMKGTPGAATKWIPKNKKCKTNYKIVGAIALGALWCPLELIHLFGVHN